MKIVPPPYDTESPNWAVAESERRRYKRDTFVSSCIEKVMIAFVVFSASALFLYILYDMASGKWIR